MNNLSECIAALLEAFPNGYINDVNIFMVHDKANQYIDLNICRTLLDENCEILEWLSYGACLAKPYGNTFKNIEFQKFMRDGINKFLGTNFDQCDLEKIYAWIGNECDHERTIRFVQSGYDFSQLEVL